MIENWKIETNKLTLFENLRLYYKIFNEGHQIDDYRWEKLDFLKKSYRLLLFRPIFGFMVLKNMECLIRLIFKKKMNFILRV